MACWVPWIAGTHASVSKFPHAREMASIDKLAIRGIRAFTAEREQTIEFGSPLTMIVGANGCGKTTIIECLKYATTGILPPNSNKGQSFVHDPKLAGSSETKANVKLRVTDRTGNPIVVCRSLKLTQNKSTMKFQQLDGVVKTVDPRGKKVSCCSAS